MTSCAECPLVNTCPVAKPGQTPEQRQAEAQAGPPKR